MNKILNLELYIGTKEEAVSILQQDYYVLSAMNVAGKFPSHRTLVNYNNGSKVLKDHPEYLVGRRQNWMALNLIDGSNYNYVNFEMIISGLKFIEEGLAKGKKVFVHCSLCESRAPSMAWMYLLFKRIIGYKDFEESLNEFLEIFKHYSPKKGIKDFIKINFEKIINK